jgi:hypothetical protein
MRFNFDEEVLVNLMNHSQKIQINPEKDMHLMVHSSEAYGINMKIKLCAERRGEVADC